MSETQAFTTTARMRRNIRRNKQANWKLHRRIMAMRAALEAAAPILSNFAGDSPENCRVYDLVCDALRDIPSAQPSAAAAERGE